MMMEIIMKKKYINHQSNTKYYYPFTTKRTYVKKHDTNTDVKSQKIKLKHCQVLIGVDVAESFAFKMWYSSNSKE